MDWATTPLATLLGGGIIGAGSALLLDSVKSRKDLQQRRQDARREVYVDYLAELSKAYESLWSLALGDYDDASQGPEVAARRIFRTGGIYQARQRLKIAASEPVIVACDAAFVNLKSFRTIVGSGASSSSPEFLAANEEYRTSVQALHQSIRIDLHIGKLA